MPNNPGSYFTKQIRSRVDAAIRESREDQELDPYRLLCAAVCERAFLDLIDAYTLSKLDESDPEAKDKRFKEIPTVFELEYFILSPEWTMYTGMTNGDRVVQVANVRSDYELWRAAKQCRKCRKYHCPGKLLSGWAAWYDGNLTCRKE